MNKEKKIGISKVVVQLGDKEATLTVEQAKELRDALNALLGEKVVERIIEKRDNWYPYYQYPQKVYVGDVTTIPTVWGTTTGTTSNNGTFTIDLGGSDPLPV